MSNLLTLDPRRLAPRRSSAPKRQSGSSLLGLAFDGSRLEGVLLRRTNGSMEVKQSFAAALSLDLLTNAPELVGRELRKHLEAAGIRERRCAVCVPLNWALTLSVKLPDLPEPDLESFLQIEVERGFPYSPDALLVERSRYRTPGGENFATLVAVPREHLGRLEAVLQAAHLKPVSFGLGIGALHPPAPDAAEGVLAMAPGEGRVALQISCGGGVAVLRTVEGAFELEGGEWQFQPDHVIREVRITLGQLPSDVRDSVRNSVRRLRIFGRDAASDEICEQLAPRVEALGIKVEPVREYAPDEFAARLPAGTGVSPALSLAARYLTGQRAAFEFLPPRVSPWKQFAGRYSSRKLVLGGTAVGIAALVVILAFLLQQWQLVGWRSKWAAMRPQVTELEHVQQQIKRFRPWYDDSFKSLSILRRLTEAFPDDGSVTAKTLEIRDPLAVSCSGTARDQQSLLRTLDRLRSAKEVTGLQVEQMRGRSPIQFTFNFHWSAQGNP